MEPNKPRGLVVSYTPPDPMMSTTPGPSDNIGIISQVSSPQNGNSHNEVIVEAVNNFIPSTTAISKGTEQVENKPFKMQTLSTKTRSRPQVSPKPEATNVTLDYYLEYISNERLRRMPARGSAWDRVLQAAQFFGLHISDFRDKLNTFIIGELLNAPLREVGADNFLGNGSGQEVLSNGEEDDASTNSGIDLVTTALTTAHSLLEVYATYQKH